MTAVQTEVGAEKAPVVYYQDDTHLFLNWIAEGTDGSLYVVPSEPAGWRRRHPYTGSREELKPVSPEKGRAIVTFVGGHHSDWGQVRIAESTLAQTELMVAPAGDYQQA